MLCKSDEPGQFTKVDSVGQGVIPQLVQKLDALHVPPKRDKVEKKPKVAQKIQEFMKQHGIVF